MFCDILLYKATIDNSTTERIIVQELVIESATNWPSVPGMGGSISMDEGEGEMYRSALIYHIPPLDL